MLGKQKDFNRGKTKDWDAVQYMKRRLPQSQYNRRSFDRIFYRNLLFYVGQQWIRYNRGNQSWRPANVPDWFPKSVTNKFAATCDSMKSVFDQSNPQVIYGPRDTSEEDIASASAAQSISDVIDTEVDNDRIRQELSAWIAITGNAFVFDSYDNSEEHGTEFVQAHGCLSCSHVDLPHEFSKGCPRCGGQNTIPAKDEMGQPMGQEMPKGRMSSEVESPFGVYFDMLAKNFEDSAYYIRAKTYPTDILKKMFPDKAEFIKSDSGNSGETGLFYQNALAYMTNSTATGAGNYGGSEGASANSNRSTLFTVIAKPVKGELPNGGYAMIASETELWKGEIPYHNDAGNPSACVTHFGFKKVPGRVFMKTPADDLIFKQVQRNKVEALIQLGIERITNGTWILPKGIGIESITGEPGEKIWYNPFTNHKPERIMGKEIPGSCFRWLDTIDHDFDELAATYEVMKGKSPKGVPTLGGAQMLLERGLSRFADGLNNWGNGWANVRRNRLYIFKEYANDERTQLILGPNSKWTSKKFSASTIAGGIDIRLDKGSTEPQSKSYKQMIAGQLMQAGLIDIQSAITRVKIMNLFDATDLIEGLDIDVKDAAREKDKFLEGEAPMIRGIIDNNIIHLEQHVMFAKTDEFHELPNKAKEVWVNHIMDHKKALDEIRQLQQQQRGPDPKQQQLQLETQALSQRKKIENDALKSKKGIDLEAMGMKKEMELGALDHKNAISKK